MDLHQRESQLCLRAANGALVERRIATTRARLSAVLGARPRARILLEASTESEWVAQHLEALGHEVIVADPNYAPMYATRTRRIKTDRRDARALLEALEHQTYRPAYRTSAARRHVRAELAVRDALVRMRARGVILARTLCRRDGLRPPPATPEAAFRRIAALALPPALAAELAPLLTVSAALTAEITAADRRLAALVAHDPDVARLTTMPQIGPVTAVAVVATVDDVRRFRSARELTAYFGLVPSERSSGEHQRRGGITKTGNARVRWLLVEAAWRVLYSRQDTLGALRAWGRRLAVRRGPRVAVVAVARRIARVLFAMWRDGVPYDPRRLARRGPVVPGPVVPAAA